MPALSKHPVHLRHRSFFQLVLLLFASCLPLISTINPLFAHTSSSQPVSHTPTGYIIPNRSVCHYSGVYKDAQGIYHFSWLHVDSATGYIMDQHNCIVDLRGFNSAGTEYADAVSPFPGLNSQRLTWFNSMFKMNYIRLNLNVGWWNSNVYVPDAQMYYQPWIEQWISWAEQNGDYVLLNRTNEYQLPPCGGTITYCPAQGEPSDLDDANPQQQFNAGHLLDQTLAFWNSIGSLYRNDPAILYDDWNELHDITAATWLTVQTTLITTIRAINPRSLIVLGSNDWNNTMSPISNGQVPDLTYPNLVYDWHIYDGESGQLEGIPCTQGKSYMWANWGAASNAQFSFAQQHGHGAVIDEWGGCLDDPTYNAALSSYAVSHHIGMAYYMAGNVVNNAWTAINANGLLAQAAYASFSY
jgi:hypothetical protein